MLFFTEMWERFGFYTMIAIYTLYMTAPRAAGGLGLDTETAGTFYSLFMGLVYFTPLLGGLAADFVVGERWAISAGAVLMAAGYFLLAVPPSSGGLGLFYLALAVIIAGNGLFKPNISTLVGKLYPAGSPLRDAAFNIFYTGINIGALGAPLAASYLRTHWSWQAAFAAAGSGMVVSLVVFTALRSAYAPAVAREHRLLEAGSDPPAAPSAAAAPGPARTPAVSTGQRISALFILYLVSAMFWTLFFQNGFALTLWAQDCTARPTWITAEEFQAVNPAAIVTLSLAAAWFWGRLAREGRDPSTPTKILLGLGAAILATAVMMQASLSGGDQCLAGGAGTRVSLWWLVGTYLLMSLAEILVSPMGLSYCTRVAPGRGGGLVMGGWFASLAAGGYLSGYLGKRFWEHMPHHQYFSMLGMGVAAVAILLLFVRPVLRRAAP